ncbi:uncharacterized protein LOC143104504 [Alosa pseudoharengus]|uniref:uncharacterized protein LOC143104504 n=1 Tax=Alosa pseudoharengus TaxID=34774 RepID=UPI003F889F22
MFTESSRPHQRHQRQTEIKDLNCMWPAIYTTTKIVLRDSKPVVLERCQCTCVAGTALCCHVAALLYQTAHYSQLRLTSVPPVFSCTETEQKWHKPRTLGIKPGPVNDMVIISARPRERRLAEGIRSNLYKGVSCPLPDISTLKVQEAYHGLSADEAPMITAMALSSNVPLVESMFGPVQEGSVLSYQLPIRTVPITRPHTDAPSPPQLPLSYYRLGPSTCSFVLSEHQHHHLGSLATSFETAHQVEKSTQEQSSCVEWHQLRRCRITSTKFREVCHTRGESSAENLAKRLLGSCHQTADMRRGLALEPVAVEEYCKVREVNHYPCGFLIHPEAPWMGSTPDGIVYDPVGQPVFGLLEIKCPNVASYVDCPYIMIKDGTQTLRQSHPYYWQVQGQMLVSGCDWCDFVVYTADDMFIQRIPRDMEVIQTIKKKVDYFFFYFYLNAFLAN